MDYIFPIKLKSIIQKGLIKEFEKVWDWVFFVGYLKSKLFNFCI